MQCQVISCANEPWSPLNYSNDLRLIIIIIYDFTHTHTQNDGYMRYKEMEIFYIRYSSVLTTFNNHSGQDAIIAERIPHVAYMPARVQSCRSLYSRIHSKEGDHIAQS